jgi:RimJ/RimL family protein N-acetyltransferase
MMDGVITETERLRLRRLTTDDAPFILRLLNDDGWLRFIGDKGVHSLGDARRYLEQGPLAMYARHGMGLWLTERKADAQPVGLCGLIRRDGLDDVDIGFAFLPEFRGEAYAYEAATAALAHGRDALGLKRIVAIATPDNERSANLLQKIGLALQGRMTLPGSDEELSFFAIDLAPR